MRICPTKPARTTATAFRRSCTPVCCKVDNDFGRTARQRKLMELLLEKVLDGGMSMTELNNLLNACMPYVQTNMKASTLFVWRWVSCVRAFPTA